VGASTEVPHHCDRDRTPLSARGATFSIPAVPNELGEGDNQRIGRRVIDRAVLRDSVGIAIGGQSLSTLPLANSSRNGIELRGLDVAEPRTSARDSRGPLSCMDSVRDRTAALSSISCTAERQPPVV
jgi:hypothetical protein